MADPIARYQGLPNALDPDPHRDDVTATGPEDGPSDGGFGDTEGTGSSAMARSTSATSSRTVSSSLGVPLQRAAMASEESLVGEGDGYVAVQLGEGSSSGARSVG